jgi:hypothetical protein
MKTPAQNQRCIDERAANAAAAAAGKPLPHPNPFDVLDPTKAPRDATPEQIHRSYLEFVKLCRPRPRKVHRL